VIPRAFRKALKIYPGSKVVFRLKEKRLILERQFINAVSVFESIAKKGPSIRKISPHAYEEELNLRIT
jgi:bifunctional DNA-binding transcriptional regulator/antitoxin component of YhaV-PrlF toxin-antitoxin module